MLYLQLFGGCSLYDNEKPVAGPVVQRRRLALLAVIASSRPAGVSRDKLVSFFWPDDDRERARHFLADSLFNIRKALGKEVVLACGDDLRLNVGVMRVDAREYEDLRAHGQTAAAAALYRGPFLDGFFVADAPEFERWADVERQRLAEIHAQLLEKLAEESENSGNHIAAAEWWKKLASHDPYSPRIALRTMTALAKRGDPAAALQHAARYERLLRDDLELPPDPAVMSLAASLRSGAGSRFASQTDLPLPTSVTRPPPSAAGEVQQPSNEPTRSRPRPLRKIIAAVTGAFVIVTVALAVMNLTGSREYRPRGSSTATALRSPLAPPVQGGSSARAEAEDLYNQGRGLVERAQSPQDYAQAIMYFERAVIRDPSFSKAYAGMADAYSYNNDPVRAKQRALTALARDSMMPEAHMAMAYVLAYYEHRWLAADSAIERATRLAPALTLAHLRRASINTALGRADIALASLDRAQQLEPSSWIVFYNRGIVASALGRSKEAIRHFQAASALEPARLYVQFDLANELWVDGRISEAAALFRSIGMLNSALMAEGDTSEMRRLVRRYETDSITMAATTAARIYTRLGERDKAFRALREAARKDRFLAMQIRVPPLGWLKGDRRYEQVMRDLGLQ